MPESKGHKRGKGSAAKTELPISRRRRLDAKRGKFAIEVERSSSQPALNKALSRLQSQRNLKKILRVPQANLEKAVDLARKKKLNVTVTNIAKTRRIKAKK